MIDENMTREIALAWLAGWFEGEGSVTNTSSFKRKYGGVYLAIKGGSTDEDVVTAICGYFGGNVAGPYHRKTPLGRTAKPFWMWQVTKTQEATDLLKEIYPFLSTRRKKQIDDALEAQRWAILPTEQERFWSKVINEGDCKLWSGGKDRYGFGSFIISGSRKQAHRYALEIAGQDIPRRLKNLCGNKNCVNADHWATWMTAIDES